MFRVLAKDETPSGGVVSSTEHSSGADSQQASEREPLSPAKDLFREDANTPDIAANVAKWVNELLTTDKPQTQGYLCLSRAYEKRVAGECCLGVWCRVGDVALTSIKGPIISYGGESAGLPYSEVKRLGLQSSLGVFDQETDGSFNDALAYLNDKGYTFKEIGAFIRDSWENQFGSPLPGLVDASATGPNAVSDKPTDTNQESGEPKDGAQ